MDFFEKKLSHSTDGVWCRVSYSDKIPFLCSKTLLQMAFGAVLAIATRYLFYVAK